MTGHSKETHKETRRKQAANDDIYHHPKEKIAQLKRLIEEGILERLSISLEVLEVFAGHGNLTKFYKEMGAEVTPLTQAETGNSFDYVFKLRFENRQFDVIDIDSYGYPTRFFPLIFELMKDECLLLFTFPIVGVNCLNGIIEQHFYTWFRGIPTIGDIVARVTDDALREWRLASLVDVVKIKRIYRLAFMCKRVNATDLCNVRNR